MNGRVLVKTESLCPECLKKIPAQYVEEDGKVWMEKSCDEHGYWKVLAWSDVDSYIAWREQSVHAEMSCDAVQASKGCPYDCGLCTEHEGKTCTAVLEITYRCNMNCAVCFADTTKHSYEPDLAKIRRMYETAYRNAGNCSIQLSGGEPTMRDDIFDILRMGKEMNFSHIQVNTNGIKLAQDADYVKRLKEAGADLIYLQFDGVNDDVYQITRGRDMMDIKLRAIENCAAAGIGVMLVPVVIKGVNDNQIGEIVAFAKEHMPTVKGIHFQPVSYFGRYPGEDSDGQWGRMNLADVIRELEVQTNGEVKKTDISPRKRYDPHCAFSSAFFLDESNTLRAITSNDQNKKVPANTDFSAKTNAYTNSYWRQPEAINQPEKRETDMKEFIDRLRSHRLSITGMGFQDAYNIDLARLKGCCVHIISNDEKAVPLCAFHVTSTRGERLYKN